MSWKAGVPILMGLIAATALLPGAVYADSVVVQSNQIQITAEIKPKTYVIVNSGGVIQQIVVNSSDSNAEIAAYVVSVNPGNEYPLTDVIKNRAALLLKNKILKPGVMYRKSLEVVRSSDDRVLTLLKAPNQKLGS